LVIVTLTYMWGRSSGATWLFISENDGATFVEHPAPARGGINTMWGGLAFVDGRRGLVVAGMASANLWRTSDSGSTWSELRMSMLPAPMYRSFGRPMINGLSIVLPVTLYTDEGDASFELLLASDAGGSFSVGKQLVIGKSRSVATDMLDGVIWAAGNLGDVVYISSDSGVGWNTVKTSGLPAGIVALDLTGPDSATAEVQEGGCTGQKVDCWQRWLLFSTTDGGRTWNAL
jgi:hypothetical protein